MNGNELKFDFNFGNNGICEPLNIYFSHHISDIINDLVLSYIDDDVKYEKCVNDIDYFVNELCNSARNYIERKYWCICDESFSVMFGDSDGEIVDYAMITFCGLYNLKRCMIGNQNK